MERVYKFYLSCVIACALLVVAALIHGLSVLVLYDRSSPFAFTRVITLNVTGTIDIWNGIKMVHEAKKLSYRAPIVVYFDSPGGLIYYGTKVKQELKKRKNSKTGVITGDCSSMCANILWEMDRIVVVNKNAWMLWHTARYQNALTGKVDLICTRSKLKTHTNCRKHAKQFWAERKLLAQFATKQQLQRYDNGQDVMMHATIFAKHFNMKR